MLTGIEPDRIIQSDVKMINVKKNWIKPFGDGKAASKTE